MAISGRRRTDGSPALLVVILLACTWLVAGEATASDTRAAVSTLERRNLQATSPTAAASNSASLTVTKGGSGSDLSIGAVVGIAMAGGVVVGIAVGLFVAYRYHVSKRRSGAAAGVEHADSDEYMVHEAFAGPDALSQVEIDGGARTMWDGAAPLSGAGARRAGL